MTGKNLGIRCTHYFSAREKNVMGDRMEPQDTMCLSICKGFDNPNNPSCHFYTSVYELETFKSYQKDLQRK